MESPRPHRVCEEPAIAAAADNFSPSAPRSPVQTLARAVTFARTVVAACRRDHGGLWVANAGDAGLRAVTFKRKVDGLTEHVVAGERLVAAAEGDPGVAANLHRFDLPGLIASAQALQAESRTLRAIAPAAALRPTPPRPGTQPLAPRSLGGDSATGGLLGRSPAPGKPGKRTSGLGLPPPASPRAGTQPLGQPHGPAGTPGLGTRPLVSPPSPPQAGPRNLAQQAAAAARQVVGVAKPPARDSVGGLLSRFTRPAQVETAPAPAALAPPVIDAARRTFAAAYKLAAEVLAYVSPRLAIVGVALRATGQPGRKKPLEQLQDTLHATCVASQVPEAQMGYMPPLAMLFYADLGAVQKVHMALTQWEDAKVMHAQAGGVKDKLRAAPPAAPVPALTQFDVGRYRAAIFPISHLHVQLGAYPYLGDFFPASGAAG